MGRRLLLVALCSFIVFRFLLIPVHVRGKSMEPTISDGTLRFCWRLQYLFTPPKRFDIITLRLAGKRVMLLKRIIGLPGETISIKNGVLYINDIETPEPFASLPSTWNLTARTIAPESYYVIGDNRNVPMDTHHFGQVAANRIIGGLLW